MGSLAKFWSALHLASVRDGFGLGKWFGVVLVKFGRRSGCGNTEIRWCKSKEVWEYGGKGVRKCEGAQV